MSVRFCDGIVVIRQPSLSVMNTHNFSCFMVLPPDGLVRTTSVDPHNMCSIFRSLPDSSYSSYDYYHHSVPMNTFMIMTAITIQLQNARAYVLIGQYVRIKSHIFTTDFSQNESETNSVQSCAVARWPAELTEPCHGCLCRDSFSN